MNKNLIVIPCLNHWAFSKACLDSVVSTINFERDNVLIINNGSTDTTKASLAGYERFSNISLTHHQDNLGVNHAVNEAIELAIKTNSKPTIRRFSQAISFFMCGRSLVAKGYQDLSSQLSQSSHLTYFLGWFVLFPWLISLSPYPC